MRSRCGAASGGVRWAVAVWVAAASLGCESPPAAERAAWVELGTKPPEAVGLDPVVLAQIDGLVAAAIEEKRLPGAVVIVGKDGAVVWRKAYGHRALDPQPVPMTVDTVFDMASLTKTMATATSVMLLAQRGQIDLSAKVTDYVPAYGQNGKDATTVEQLLTHTAGLIPDNPVGDYDDGAATAMERIYALKPTHAIGSRFRYTDVGYIMLGEIVRRVAGVRLDEFALRDVFGPLGMDRTRFNPPEAWWPQVAPQNRRDGAWIVGQVHDPRAYRMAGVAGHAGLFSTADDVARFAQMILNDGRVPGSTERLLTAETAARMTRVADGATHGRGLGFDVDTGYSSPRGDIFPKGESFGHTGFTGTSLWISRPDRMFVAILSNRLHPDGKGNVIALRRKIGTVAASAIRREVLPGLDVLVRDGFTRLAGRKVGVITNHTGRSRTGTSTVELLANSKTVELVAIFSPEHGIRGVREGRVGDARDEATGLPIHSLYGETRRPTAAMLRGIDTLVFDIQDIGTRFYTFVSTMGNAMEAAAEHGVRFVVLDRPNPISGMRPAGPLADADKLSFVAFHRLPVRHGMTIGELARLLNEERGIGVDLEVVKVEGWRRGLFFDATGLEWINPSPNMRSLTEAILYPAIGLLETTNLSVGRGTDRPFEHIGAPWIDGPALAEALTALGLPGVRFSATRFTPTASKFANEECHGVAFRVVDRFAFAPARTGLAIARELKRLYARQWKHETMNRLLVSDAAMAAWQEADTLDDLVKTWQDDLRTFRTVRAKYLLYK